MEDKENIKAVNAWRNRRSFWNLAITRIAQGCVFFLLLAMAYGLAHYRVSNEYLEKSASIEANRIAIKELREEMEDERAVCDSRHDYAEDGLHDTWIELRRHNIYVR